MLLFSSHTGDFISSDEAFLFSLRNRVGSAFKAAILQDRQWLAMYSWIGQGPTFGGSPRTRFRSDLYISRNCHTNTWSHSDLAYTYMFPAGYRYTYLLRQSLLAGSYRFKCNEYEVFYQQ